MPKRYFTVEQANAMVPHLKEVFNRLLQLRTLMRGVYGSLEQAGHAPDDDDFEAAAPGVPAEALAERVQLKALMETFREELQGLEARGCLVKGVEPGLVDWFARVEGRDVLLCWKHGEDEVAWWHELEAGFAGRRPIADLARRGSRSEDDR